jgi:hypothetical protein
LVVELTIKVGAICRSGKPNFPARRLPLVHHNHSDSAPPQADGAMTGFQQFWLFVLYGTLALTPILMLFGQL